MFKINLSVKVFWICTTITNEFLIGIIEKNQSKYQIISWGNILWVQASSEKLHHNQLPRKINYEVKVLLS